MTCRRFCLTAATLLVAMMLISGCAGTSEPAKFFLLLTLLFPVFNILLAKIFYKYGNYSGSLEGGCNGAMKPLPLHPQTNF